MPHLKTPYRSLPLSTPTVNYYDYIIGRPELKEWPDYTVHIDVVTGERRRFRAVLERIELAAIALTTPLNDGGIGLVPQQSGLVGILSENCLEFPILVLALLKIAVPLALLPSLSTLHETVTLLKLSDISTLFVSEKMFPHARAAAKEVGFSEDRIFILQGGVDGKISLPRLIDGVKARGLPKVPTETVQDDTLAYLVYSSGTTGLPKGVMASHRNMVFSTSQLGILSEEVSKVNPPGVLSTPEKIPVHASVLPWYHTMGAHAFIFRLFIAPVTLVVFPQWSVDLVLKAFSLYKITHFMMVPSMTYQMIHNPKLAKIDLSSLAYATAGAAHLPPELRLAFQRKAKSLPFLFEGYGMSECTYSAISLPFPGALGGRFNPVRGMAGILNPSMEARILRADGTDADYNETGELVLRGPTVVLGYWKNQKATKETFRDGWLYTGDRFYVDEQERFFYVDRIKDTLKISGKQVSPTEIENTILEHPSRFVTDVAVAGVSGERMSDEPVPRAWVVLSSAGKQQGPEAVFAALEEWTRSRLSKYKWLRGGLQVVDEIPRLPTGKILRRKLQDEFARSENERPKAQAKL
ncbi:amp dependent CoA ligase [Multifurca ochricompacta]|uniref:Amp dependent CoA ligase n=1 Tax=Multifurca ochricompacta TaxID=376703 RepID=A0AAD4M7M6_9AGAM|nr:amp dependent CoA ligase [Multifurca ochricompacta]